MTLFTNAAASSSSWEAGPQLASSSSWDAGPPYLPAALAYQDSEEAFVRALLVDLIKDTTNLALEDKANNKNIGVCAGIEDLSTFVEDPELWADPRAEAWEGAGGAAAGEAAAVGPRQKIFAQEAETARLRKEFEEERERQNRWEGLFGEVLVDGFC